LIAHLNQLLDEALSETFPASDAIAIAVAFESEEEIGSAEEASFCNGCGVALPFSGIHPAVNRANKVG